MSIYTTELSKGQGAVDETLSLLQVWTPGMPADVLAHKTIAEGGLGRSTAVRTRDLAQRVFARRYLGNGGTAAANLKYLIDQHADRSVVKQLMLIYTSRLHLILRDFIAEVYWNRYSAGAERISRSDAEEFIQQRLVQERSAKHATANQQARIEALTQALEQKKGGWDASPISTARIYAELWPLITNEDWCLSSPSSFSGGHNTQLWDHNKPYSYLGGQGAGGMGYGAPASVGAALAAKSRGRIVINVQTDGDLNYAPGVLWTAAHHQLPMLTIMHNNRAWHQELMFVEYMCGVRGRGGDRGHIGTTLREPAIDYRMMAGGYGMAAEGPITDPSKLSAALKRGVASVKRGEPYLIDVITQPR